MTTPKTGRLRGRPSKTLREDKDRFAIAYIAARLILVPATRPTTLARVIALIDGLERRSPQEVMALVGAIANDWTIHTLGADDDRLIRWRDRDRANARAEALWRKARDLLHKLRDPSDADDASDDQRDGHWLGLMSTAWLVLFGYYRPAELRADPLDVAGALVASIGEAKHFNNVVRPVCSNLERPIFRGMTTR